MARPLRVEFDWSLHPAINRVKLRADPLAREATQEAFERRMREAYGNSSCGWTRWRGTTTDATDPFRVPKLVPRF